MIVKWNHRVEDKFAYRASSISRPAVRMADISLTEALGVQFYCYRGTKLAAATRQILVRSIGSGALSCSLDLFARENFRYSNQTLGYGSNFRGFNFRTAVYMIENKPKITGYTVYCSTLRGRIKGAARSIFSIM